VAHARFRCIPRLLMHFLSGNTPIVRIARRFGMNIVTAAGESSAHLELPLVSLAGGVTCGAGKGRPNPLTQRDSL
jgi:hypothetical protein